METGFRRGELWSLGPSDIKLSDERLERFANLFLERMTDPGNYFAKDLQTKEAMIQKVLKDEEIENG